MRVKAGLPNWVAETDCRILAKLLTSAREWVGGTETAPSLVHTEHAWHEGSTSCCSSVPLSNTCKNLDKFSHKARQSNCPLTVVALERGDQG